MRLVTYRTDGRWEGGFEQDGAVVSLSALGAEQRSVKGLLAADGDALARALERARSLLEAEKVELEPLNGVELGPPVPDPDKIICLGLNYLDHAVAGSQTVPEVPTLFAKFRTSLVGPFGQIMLPRVSDQIDYEGELAVVIGRIAKDVPEKNALKYVAGYACFNDVSARDVQTQTSQWTAGKALDTFAPMGPGIVPPDEIPHVQQLALTTRVNGEVVQQAGTSDMVFSVAESIAFISSLMTLVPGDIIATGTPAGVGAERIPPIYLKAGDSVEVEVERIGTIRNPVISLRSQAHGVLTGLERE